MSNNAQKPTSSPRRRHERQYFYKYMSADTAKIVLATRKLRWSSPLEFNDPFDVTQELRLNFDESTLIGVLYDEFATLIEEGKSQPLEHPVLSMLFEYMCRLDSDERKEIAEDFRCKDKASPTEGQVQALEGIKQMWRETVPKSRVLCFSECIDVTSMWNHYADGYKGVVLQFEASDATDSALLLARPVVYQDEPPAIADPQVWARCLLGTSDVRYEQLLIDLQYIKTADWSNEREWRVVSMARAGDTGRFADYGFNPRELVGVCFGAQCNSTNREDTAALLSHGLEHVTLWEAVQDTREAKFRIRSIPTAGNI